MEGDLNSKIWLYEYYFRMLSKQNADKDFENIWFQYEVNMKKHPDIAVTYKDILVLFEITTLNCDNVLVEKKQDTYDAFEVVKQICEKESNWEQKCYAYLQNLAKQHPLIAWFIVSVLLSILLGLLTEVISEGISSERNINHEEIFEYMESEDIEMIIRDVDESISYKIIHDKNNE